MWRLPSRDLVTPLGGAHKDYDASADALLAENASDLLDARYKRFRKLGIFGQAKPAKKRSRTKKSPLKTAAA